MVHKVYIIIKFNSFFIIIIKILHRTMIINVKFNLCKINICHKKICISKYMYITYGYLPTVNYLLVNIFNNKFTYQSTVYKVRI